MRATPRTPPLAGLSAALLLAGACGGGGSASDPIAAAPIELLACRARVDQPATFAEIAERSSRNLGANRIADRAGVERSARLAPDGDAVALVRETTLGDAASREVHVASRSGAFAERRITSRPGRDDGACWSPDGARILFASDRDGGESLWTVDAGGGDPVRLLLTPTGFADVEPDWHAPTGRVVWSRRGPSGGHALWTAAADGSNALPLTDGGGLVGAGAGDREPAFAPTGAMVAFVRRSAPDVASLCLCDLATGAVTTAFAPTGDVASPRIAPTMDRIFFGLAEPAAGRTARRLAQLPLAGGAPTLLWPDERWRLEGLDLLPSLPPADPAAAPVRLDIGGAQVQIAVASSAAGDRAALRDDDGDEYVLTTATVDGREVAAINVRFDLPVAVAEDLLAFDVRIRLRSDRADGDAVHRTSLYNPVDERFDTVVERPATTSESQLAFATSSLRHVTTQRQVRVTAIADLPAGARATVRIDLVEVVMTARAR